MAGSGILSGRQSEISAKQQSDPDSASSILQQLEDRQATNQRQGYSIPSQRRATVDEPPVLMSEGIEEQVTRDSEGK